MTDSSQNAAVLELLASRICHDLISPVGAINNGIEFMQESGPEDQEEGLNLISYSAAQAAAKLQAFRLAYGAGGRDPGIKPEDIQRAFASLVSAEGKISQLWDPFGPLGVSKPYPPAFCKMLMAGLMLAMESLPKGGSVSARAGETDGETLFVAEGTGATVRENVEEALARSIAVDDLDPRLVHPYALSVLADSYGYKISLKEKVEGKVSFSLIAPAVKEEPAEEAAEPEAAPAQ